MGKSFYFIRKEWSPMCLVSHPKSGHKVGFLWVMPKEDSDIKQVTIFIVSHWVLFMSSKTLRMFILLIVSLTLTLFYSIDSNKWKLRHLIFSKFHMTINLQADYLFQSLQSPISQPEIRVNHPSFVLAGCTQEKLKVAGW